MAKKQIDLGLTGLDELFMDDRERAESKLPKIHEIPLSEIDEFPNHPFHVRLDEDMDQLVESIKERGIITPVTLRQKPDGGMKSSPATAGQKPVNWRAWPP